MEIIMKKDKETKGAVRYSEEEAVEGSPKNIYFRKTELLETFGEFPESITVTIEAN